MNWREWTKMVLAALLPVFYFWLVSEKPTFPIDQNKFIELILWIIFESGYFMKLGYKLYLINIRSVDKENIFKYSGFLLW